ncbi:MAG: hypothetical protein M3036_06370 [Bifidobacteriales bacterium]|nr:hypothetical protein [Bifidobacteriales bacterium]
MSWELRAKILYLKRELHHAGERIADEQKRSRQLAEDRDALLAQNCRLRAQRDDALARRKRDEKGRFR